MPVGVQLDHLVVAAASLDEGVQWCEATLGVTPAAGGRHPLMGTHNRLLCLASAAFPQAYFELIAIDPAARAPARARWFGLDALDLTRGPRLLHWVARSAALDTACAALRAAGFDPGEVIAASRDTPQGRLDWRITVRRDGSLAAGGALPTLIAWGASHPSASLPASGLVLHALTLRGLAPAAVQALDLPRIDVAVDAGPTLTAVLDTPRGRVTLCSD